MVTDARQHWLAKSQVTGLRDAAAVDPAKVAREGGLDPRRIAFDWKEYLALDDASVERRFEKRFSVPPGAKVSLRDGVLTLAGTLPTNGSNSLGKRRRSCPE